MFREVKITDKEKSKSINDFIIKHSDSGFWLACHAALPLFFRLDWLYHLWANFRNQIFLSTRNKVKYHEIVNILNSPFTNKVGYEIYEFDSEIRDFLLYELQQQFGIEHIHKLATFLYQYSEKNSPDTIEKGTHQTTAWSILYPQQAAIAISEAFSKAVEQENESEQVRLYYVMETMLSPINEENKKPFEQIKTIAELNKDLIPFF